MQTEGNMKREIMITAMAAALAGAFGIAHAGDTRVHRPGGWNAGAHALSDVEMNEMLRNGYSAERLLGMDVAGTYGDSIGEVENIVLSRDGSARAIVVATGGVFGLGETTYRIPWKDVRLDMQQDRLFVPLASENLAQFRWGAEGDRARAGELLADSILDGTVALSDGRRTGEVGDLIIGRDGDVKAVIVSSDYFGGEADQYAYPVEGQLAFNAMTHHYTLPFASSDRVQLDVFDYDRFGIDAPDIGVTSGASGEGEVGSSM
jgi:sporulation protein YlmC with PRC-barrel domain